MRTHVFSTILFAQALLVGYLGCVSDESGETFIPVDPGEDTDSASDRVWDSDSHDGSPADTDSGSTVVASSFSYVGEAALEALSEFPSEQYSTWNFRYDTTLDPHWVLQTPLASHWGQPESSLHNPGCKKNCHPDFGLKRCREQSDCSEGGTCRLVESTVSHPGQTPERLCVGHSDAFYDDLYLGIIQAKRFVDIASLSPQDERFEAAVRNALTYLSAIGSSIDVRLLYGNWPVLETKTGEVLHSLTRDMEPNAPVTVYLGVYRKGLDSWNHAKIIAVDGELLITGGHNMWTRDYLKRSPVHDLSMIVRGTIAKDAHLFTNTLWAYTCTKAVFPGSNSRSSYPDWAPDCPPDYEPDNQEEPEPTGIPTIALGRLGALGANPADKAILAMIRAARSNLKMSLQDIGPVGTGGIRVGSWPEPLLKEWGIALMRGVDIYLVLSNLDSVPDGQFPITGGYSNGWSAKDVLDRVYTWLQKHPKRVPEGTDIRAQLCDHFHVGTLRFNDTEEKYKDGSGIGNHAKFFIVDDRAFYLGSQNLYESNLAEFGLLIDDAEATSEIFEEYWQPLWQYSEKTIVSGRTSSKCELM